MASSLRLPQRIGAQHFWNNFDNILFDADGVLWREQQPLEGAVELVGALLKAGKRVVVVTNNSTQSCAEYVKKCQRIGFTDLDEQNIVSSGMVLAHQLNKMKRSAEFGSTAHLPVYLFGSVGLQRLLKESGIDSFGTGPDPMPADTATFVSDLPNLDLGVPRPFAVVAGYDIHLSYAKVMRAANWLKEKAVPFLVTNEDATFPGPNPDRVIPGAGAVTSVLRYVTGREPTVMGKPSAVCWQYICEKTAADTPLDPLRTVIVGDRCDTDILFGRLNGLSTLLVLSGVHSLADAEHFRGQGQSQFVPEFYAASLAELLPSTEQNGSANAVN
ncbi:hypothetical protein niasHT_019593 [Heterodera trifolii]|uniref:4-nitrophenylphosphatase n=1 Tax=Heterodera trifolii TaxID=157864 RepID=A0ABD2L886_9BILA